VDLSGSRPNPPLVVPAAAILFRTDGAQVATVRPDQTVHLQKITVGRDYGDRVEILQGIAEGTTIVAVPGDAAREGAKIVPVAGDAPQK
jgi:multidrug efflux pump subunit AcrA (membrane-fusion protein)